MDEREFSDVDAEGQLAALEQRALDSRAAVKTGFPTMDAQLHRGGLHRGNLALLGGRTHTRKTAVALNMAVNILKAGTPVGLLGLDESLEMYVSKLMSITSRIPSEKLEDNWNEAAVLDAREDYLEVAKNLTLSRGVRPSVDSLDSWLEQADITGAGRPEVVFIDYVSLLVHYRGKENERVARLMEELQVWTSKNDLVVVALHQSGRTDEGISKKSHGDTPGTAEGLLYGGDQQADIIFLTYRPALHQLGNLSQAQAKMLTGKEFDEEAWMDARTMVMRYKTSTFLQLVKNRPSVKGLNFEGVELTSPDESQYMQEHGDAVSPGGRWAAE